VAAFSVGADGFIQMIKEWQAWIFDLDDTLLDTSGALIPQVAQRVCEYFVRQNLFTNREEALSVWLEYKIKLAGKILIRKIVEERVTGFERREKLIQEAYQIFRTPELPLTLPLLPGGREILQMMSSKVPLFLVTQGDIPTQIKKVEILNLTDYFRQIYYVDPFMGEDKSLAFKALLKQFGFDPHRVLSIGNRLDNEIELSKKLEMKTCYHCYGEHQGELPQNKNQQPDFKIYYLSELQGLVKPDVRATRRRGRYE
jgi:FMN phosphatase YigB (HAD superfamily)